MPKLVIFDLDETLLFLPVDWNKAKLEIAEYGKREGIAPDFSQQIIPFSVAVSTTAERKRKVDSIWRKHEQETIEKKGIIRYPKAEGFVKKLKSQGYELAIASNNSHATIEQALTVAGIMDCFSKIKGRDDVQNPKPAPDMLLALAAESKLEKGDIVFIGDSEGDRVAGAAAKIRTLLIKPDGDFPEI